jgi:hypothetical protein
MGKAERNRRQSARERIAAQQAAARRAEARRRVLVAGGSVLTVIAIVVGFIIVKSLQHPPAAHAVSRTPNATVAREVTNVPATVLDSVGAGPTGSTGVQSLIPLTGQPPLTQGGKPEMLYIGEESCPFCAAERWGMVVALSRFGTFSGLRLIRSSSHDVFSNTDTLTFYQAAYSSKYLDFQHIEVATSSGKRLETPNPVQQALMTKYDAAPYVPASAANSFPFIDVGNQFLVVGAQYSPGTLGTLQPVNPSHLGLSWQAIARELRNPHSALAQRILGTANHLTAAICKITNGQPGSVCKSAAVTAIGRNI